MWMELEMDGDDRKCGECGAECAVEATVADGHGVRFVLMCEEHGPQAVIDPFSEQR